KQAIRRSFSDLSRPALMRLGQAFPRAMTMDSQTVNNGWWQVQRELTIGADRRHREKVDVHAVVGQRLASTKMSERHRKRSPNRSGLCRIVKANSMKFLTNCYADKSGVTANPAPPTR